MASPVESLPVYDNELVSLCVSKDLSEEISRQGVIRHYAARMDDGELYPVLIGKSKHPNSDTAVAFTTAWMTSTKGHNRHTMLHVMQHGYPVVMIGPEGELTNHTLSLQERLEQARRVRLTKVAYDMNRILDVALEQAEVRSTEVISLGESRGAMVGFGLGVEQYSGKRKLVYGDFTAPCFARAAKVAELPGIIGQLAPELVTLGGLAVRLFGSRLRHYPDTLHKDPEYYLKEFLKIPHLLNGQAGQLASAMQPDTPLHIKNFDGDSWSQAKEWSTLFEERPNVVLEHSHGRHLAIANPETLRDIEARLCTLAEIRGFDGSFDAVNFQEVLHAHEADVTPTKVGKTAVKAA